MIECANIEKEEFSENLSSETDLHSNVILGPGNSSFFDLSKRNLKYFPPYLFDICKYVKYLYLEHNFLQELSESFFPSLPSLQWLDVRNNILRTLPKSIANHPNLEVLLLQGNQIQILPLELGLVPKLKGIQLLGNPITFPPQEVLARGVQSLIEYLREEHSIQAPSPSTIRPIADPFYKGVEFKDDLALRDFKLKTENFDQGRKSSITRKKRATSTNLPVIMVKSYQKLELESVQPRPKTSVPLSQFKLSETPQPEEIIFNERKDIPDLSNQIQTVGNKIVQLWPKRSSLSNERCKTETKIFENLLKEMFVKRIKQIQEKQAEIIQRTKDKETLRKWRQSGSHMKHKQDSGVKDELPYDTDSNYMTMLSRSELQNPMSRKWQNKDTHKKAIRNVGEEMSEIFKSLQKLENSRIHTDLSPRAEQSALKNEIQTLMQLQKKLKVLHFRNANQDDSVLSLPVQGQHVEVRNRKNTLWC